LFARGDDALFEGGYRSGQFAAAYELFAAAQARAVARGDRAGEADAVYYRGLTMHYESIVRRFGGTGVDAADIDAEEELFRRSLAPHRALGGAGAARPLFGLGLVMQVLRRDGAAAEPLFRQALELVDGVEAQGDLYTCSEIHRHMGFFYAVQDVQLPEAIKHLELSLAFRERLGDPRRVPSGLAALGDASLAAGQVERAVELFQRAARDAREAGLLPFWIADAERGLREALEARDR
jgi:tetratricopeptide (TPR) repeat protein